MSKKNFPGILLMIKIIFSCILQFGKIILVDFYITVFKKSIFVKGKQETPVYSDYGTFRTVKHRLTKWAESKQSSLRQQTDGFNKPVHYLNRTEMKSPLLKISCNDKGGVKFGANVEQKWTKIVKIAKEMYLHTYSISFLLYVKLCCSWHMQKPRY